MDPTPMVKRGWEGVFLGTGPGQGSGFPGKRIPENNRILIPVYQSCKSENSASVICSDDNGITWRRSEKICTTAMKYRQQRASDGTILSFGRPLLSGVYPGFTAGTAVNTGWKERQRRFRAVPPEIPDCPSRG